MSLDTRPTSRPEHTAAAAAPHPGPVERVVAGSLVAGLLTATVLVLVVFAGATESVITGSALVGFALGWALLAALTIRLTARPQRWAVVPAVLMGVTGVALVVLAPGDAVMSRLAWVWPPVVLAMSAWMALRARRSLPGRGRLLLAPVIAVLVLASVGALREGVVQHDDVSTYPAPGKTFHVDGHRMHLDCHGQGAPTVVLLNGLGEVSASWARVAGPVAHVTRVCAYDRAGQGWSEAVDQPQDGVSAARDLRALLAAAGETGPFVLVGHSTGGAYAMTYAARYPDQVAGMVLLDSSSPHQLTRIPAYPTQYAAMRRGLALLPTLARLGVSRLFPGPSLPGPAGAQVQALTSSAKAARNGRDEISVAPRVFAQARALTTLGDRPLAVLTASESLEGAGWRGAQAELAGLANHHVQRTVRSSHEGLLTDAGPAAESARVVEDVVSSIRNHHTLEQ